MTSNMSRGGQAGFPLQIFQIKSDILHISGHRFLPLPYKTSTSKLRLQSLYKPWKTLSFTMPKQRLIIHYDTVLITNYYLCPTFNEAKHFNAKCGSCAV